MHKFVKNYSLKKYFVLYRPFLLFLGTFFLCYIVLTFIYQGFLSCFEAGEVDAITKTVALNTEQIIAFFDKDSAVKPNEVDGSYVLYFHQKAVARIVEGCNAISVVILFVSFIAAFSAKLKSTLLFILAGSFLIYILNVVRITILIFLMYYFPEQNHLFHGVVFPLFIYGVVFVLWVIWVNKFSKYAK